MSRLPCGFLLPHFRRPDSLFLRMSSIILWCLCPRLKAARHRLVFVSLIAVISLLTIISSSSCSPQEHSLSSFETLNTLKWRPWREEHSLNFYLSLDLQTTITFDLELRLLHRLRPRVHRGELYKTHTINLEDPTLLKEKINLASLDLGYDAGREVSR
ncbi:uncharacterized protein [Arachis hypogaea]|uniref:uncharacterized protein n=1 Tax=Arachis hypogaea TaxID=3818 RepID=UPI003B2177A2